MKIAFFSDTHTLHKEWYLSLSSETKNDFNSAELLIFTGDYSDVGSYKDTEAFLSWFNKRPNKHKIMIAGNHDFFFDTAPSKRIMFPRTQFEIDEMLSRFDSIHYLENNSVIIEGLKIWGSPISKWFYDWAFNRYEGSEIQQYWNMIPEDIDILLTHGPAYGIQDAVKVGEPLGEKDLLNAIQRVQPKIFACGHIHEGYGKQLVGETLHINSSSLDGQYGPVNDPVIIDGAIDTNW